MNPFLQRVLARSAAAGSLLLRWLARAGMFICSCVVGAILASLCDLVDPSKILGSVLWTLVAFPMLVCCTIMALTLRSDTSPRPSEGLNKADMLCYAAGLALSLYLVITR